ncbi:TetR/AcrR family transcriptional regulator [Actinomadura fulvescens]|uniref:TetR/AcrR family transcriptional regulator n=1 Tax=Actinomadura fulvescens TaxID=46160 RepID=A0ABN3QMR9_9ACTN
MSTEKHGRQVGRGAKVRTAVLAATLAELADHGYAALTIDNIARRAGVHKTTIYRRWKDRESLVVDVLGEQIAVDIPMPDTGSVDTDLRDIARAFVAWVTSPAGQTIFAAIFSDAARIPGIVDARRQLFEEGPRRASSAISRAVQRGELPPDTDAEELIKTLIAPLYFRLAITTEPLDQAAADHAARVALAAARAGALSSTNTNPQ